ncbi:MAG TPA: hypothetical protein VE779_00915 [Candidatus Angelobacter sp.]|nr:hypothetical protein [Candidatus Angelobacter sp.]
MPETDSPAEQPVFGFIPLPRDSLNYSHDGREGSTRINQDASVYASLLTSGETVELPLAAGRHAWVQLVSGELDVNGTQLKKGDGAAISEESKLTLASVGGNGAAEFLLFDLA